MNWPAYENVERIRRSHKHARPNPAENPAWANAELDIGHLLGAVDELLGSLKTAAAELERYIDLQQKLDYIEYATTTQKKLGAINAVIAKIERSTP